MGMCFLILFILYGRKIREEFLPARNQTAVYQQRIIPDDTEGERSRYLKLQDELVCDETGEKDNSTGAHCFLNHN